MSLFTSKASDLNIFESKISSLSVRLSFERHFLTNLKNIMSHWGWGRRMVPKGVFTIFVLNI